MKNSDESIIINLEDAGCNDVQIQDFMQLKTNRERLFFLRQYRTSLLETVHSEQKKLECLDFLIYRTREPEE